MEYKHLVQLLDSLIENQSRSQSASRKNRPESSSPDKLKMRNPGKASHESKKDIRSSSDDNYSDEEIADDPDEGEDSQIRNDQANAVAMQDQQEPDPIDGSEQPIVQSMDESEVRAL